jgi:hypothetical protein
VHAGADSHATALLARLSGWLPQHAVLTAAITAAALVATVAGRVWPASRRHRHHSFGSRLIRIAPPLDVEPASAAALWANLAGILSLSLRQRLLFGPPHVVWEYTWTGRQLHIGVWVPGTVPPRVVEQAVRGAWPAATVTTHAAEPPIPTGLTHATGGQLLPLFGDWLPIDSDGKTDPLRAVLAAGTGLRDNEHASIQILARPASRRRVRAARHVAGRLRYGKPATPTIDVAAPIRWLLDAVLQIAVPQPTAAHPSVTTLRDPHLDRQVRAIVDKTSQPLWDTALRYVAATTPRGHTDPMPRLRGICDGLASAFAVYTGHNQLSHRVRSRHPLQLAATRRLGAGFLTGTTELAALAALPTDPAIPGLDRARAATIAPPIAVPTGGRGTKILGSTPAGHAIALPVADARHHVHLLGATGSGKTTLLTNLIIGDVRAGRGTVVIDPHGDLIVDVLDRLPATDADRLVIIDPDQPNPPVLNPLDGDDHNLIVDNIVAIMSSIFVNAWGPRMDDVMRVACLTLLRHAGVTLQHIPPLLNSRQFRAQMTAGLDDPEGLAGFWQWYDELTPALRSQVIGPVLARLRAFLLRDFVKATMGQPHSTIDMARILDGGVLLARLPKGTLGEDTSRLMGSLILAKVWQTATARANTPAERRRDAAIYLDEAQNFLTLAASLDTMLAEARKYRLSMVLAHQNLGQFPRDLLAAVSANARNKLYFQCSPEDAHQLARHTAPELDEYDLTHLDAYTAAARLVISGQTGHAFTLASRPPRPVVGETTAIRQAVAARPSRETPAAIDELARVRPGRRDPGRVPATLSPPPPL